MRGKGKDPLDRLPVELVIQIRQVQNDLASISRYPGQYSLRVDVPDTRDEIDALIPILEGLVSVPSEFLRSVVRHGDLERIIIGPGPLGKYASAFGKISPKALMAFTLKTHFVYDESTLVVVSPENPQPNRNIAAYALGVVNAARGGFREDLRVIPAFETKAGSVFSADDPDEVEDLLAGAVEYSVVNINDPRARTVLAGNFGKEFADMVYDGMLKGGRPQTSRSQAFEAKKRF